MSERCLLFPALVLALSASALGAQQTLADLHSRREELSARAESLRVAVERLRAVERDSGLVTDARVGALRIRTSTALQPVARAALETVRRAAGAVLGASLDSIEQGLTLTLRENRSSVTWRSVLPLGAPTALETKERMTSATLEGWYDGRGLSGVTLYPPVTSDDIADGVLSLLGVAAASDLPPALAEWIGRVIPLRESAPEHWLDAYRMMATADAAVVRRCVAGDRAACRLAFALDSLPSNRVAAWYDDSDLPGLAKNAGDHIQRASLSSALNAEERDECTERHNLDICRRMLALLPADAYRIPMSRFDRQALVSTALRAGGPEALQRMRAAGGSIADQLSAAGGVPADSLVAVWQRRVMAARPSSPLPSVTFVLASLACIAVCVILAARGQPWK